METQANLPIRGWRNDTRADPLLPERAQSECARSTAAVGSTRVPFQERGKQAWKDHLEGRGSFDERRRSSPNPSLPYAPEQRRGWSLMIFCARRTRTMKRMARWLAWSLCSQSPHDKTVVARCAQWRPHQPPRLMQRKSRAKPDLDARSGRSISPHPLK